MDPRRHVQPPYEGRNVQASAVQRHGQLSVGYLHSRHIHPPELLENVLAQQAKDLHELAGKNDYLARNNEYCRYDLGATQREINQLSEHMRINKEKDGRTIKDLLDRIAKTESDIFDGESIKKELEESLIEKQMLLHDRHVLTSKIQQASQELGNAQIDLKRLPELRAELDSLREKLQREQKKSLEQGDLIIQEVAHMKIMEKNLEDMIKEIEQLRAELLNAVRLPNELVQEFVASRQEIKKLKEHIRNIRTEKDKEIANLLDRIGKMESGINENESIRRELEEAHIEAQNLAAARDDLTSQIHEGSQELEKARSDIKMIPEMVAERDTLKTKHKKLW
ncbi:hypothetical protein Leryth_018602 [Lithospermum erythrorhizon]|nr:hypothetical protein Leryth_018602 [Lithospermum erythrorhizon]